MKIKALLTALVCTIIFTGCKQNQQACAAYASQCDELYMSDYNCVIQYNTSNTSYYPAYYLRPTTFYRYPVANYTTNNYYNCSEPQENIVVSPRPTLNYQTTQRRPQRPQPTQQPKTRTRQ